MSGGFETGRLRPTNRARSTIGPLFRSPLLQVWITRPHGAKLRDLTPALERRWTMAAKYLTDFGHPTTVHFCEALPGEIHGEFLTRLWVTEIRDHDDPFHVISEIDFNPQRLALVRLFRDATSCALRLVAPAYVTRDYLPEQHPARDQGVVRSYRASADPQDPVHLMAPWFVYLDLRDREHVLRLPETWLGASGPFNDAANTALVTALEAGFLSTHPRNWGLLFHRDAWPAVHGVRYPRIGTHYFFARALDQPDDSVICWPDHKDSLTAGEHYRNIRRLINCG